MCLIAQTNPVESESKSAGADQLEAEKTWQLKNDEQSLEAIAAWLDEAPNSPTDALKKATNAFNDSSYSADRLDRVIAALGNVRPDIAKIASQLDGQRKSVLPPNFSHLLDNENEHPFVRNHVRLLLGRWLAQNQFYDEALEQLDLLETDKLLPTESALFYRALVEHQLLRKTECKETIETLLQHESELPTRFAVVAKLMEADLKPVEDGSLDEISRVMKDIHRRTQFQRSGTLVLKQEAEVIEKLDKLIEELEEQQNQSQSSAPGSGSQPSGQPMEQSRAAQGKGSGKVTTKDLADGGQWGNLEPAERSAAMAEMVKDMPPHFRSAIEKYFRRLAARESDQEEQQ